ncbi:hypothetical protein EDD85DRAFT_866697, partial [Armillaria nabsnona]
MRAWNSYNWFHIPEIDLQAQRHDNRCSPLGRLYLIRSYGTFPSTVWVRRALLHRPLQHKSLLPPTTMTSLNACLQVVRLTEPAGDSVPYLESMAKVAVLVFKLLDQKAKNKESAKELCERIANTTMVIDTLVRMQGEGESSCYIDICEEMEKYLQGTRQDMTDIELKDRGIKGVFCVDEFRDAIQAYRRRVDDLKTDASIHSSVDCRLEGMQVHCAEKDVVAQAVACHWKESDEFVFRISKGSVAIMALFFFFFPLFLSDN